MGHGMEGGFIFFILSGIKKKYYFSLGGEQEMQVVNESGLYYMIMRSNKPNAKAFQKVVYKNFVTHEFRRAKYFDASCPPDLFRLNELFHPSPDQKE